MRLSFALAVAAGFAATVHAQMSVSSVAVQTGTIQPGGPRLPVNGDRFLNIEGLNNGAFASYGAVRWDLTQARADLNAAYGAGQWHITKIELEMTQDNAAFSTGGPVQVYYSTDDVTDIKTAAGGLAYPFFDPVSGAPDLALGNGGAPILSYAFVVIGTGTLDRYTQTGSYQNGAPVNPAEVLALANDLVQHITSQNTLTLIFNDGDAALAATYRGQESFSGRVGPNLFITAEGTGPAPCYANCDASTNSPILNVNDFICFNNLFAAGNSLANCDASTTAPVLNVNDFTCFLNRFAIGCS